MSEHGKVKVWLDTKGYGFIALDCGGPDLFCHCSDLARGSSLIPLPGEMLSCEVETTPRGLRALAVEFDADELE